MSFTTLLRQTSDGPPTPPARRGRRTIASVLAAATLAGGMALAAGGPAAAATIETTVKPGGLAKFCKANGGHLENRWLCVLPDGATVTCKKRTCHVHTLEVPGQEGGASPAALPKGVTAAAR